MVAAYPALRLRRSRQHHWSRRLVQETKLDVNDLIWPIFICEGTNKRDPISSMPDVSRLSVDLAVKAAKMAADLSIPCLALFPNTPFEKRSEDGSESFNENNLINRALKAIKDEVPGIGLIADVALDPYTSHGQDGLLEDGIVLNDETIEVLAKQAIAQARSGADIIAPSDMMDGRVAGIRSALDSEGFQNVQIMSYSAKFASAFYGPFRDALGAKGVLKGNKKTYQMDPANISEALREVEQDIMEGADSIMVKPGLPYLDVIKSVKETFNMPTFAYQVSGEYSMIKAAAQNGWLEEEQIAFESLLAFKRAGADGIFTYFAPEIAKKILG